MKRRKEGGKVHKGTYERVVGAVIITRACYIVGPRRPLSEIAARRSCSILRGAPRPPVLLSLKVEDWSGG